MADLKIPTTPVERIEIIDALRGFAVLGILLSNILIFSGFLFTPFTKLKQFSSYEFNEILYKISDIVISGKFYPIFCILFGYGFYMQVAKYDNKNPSFLSYYSRRLFLLLTIGIMHQAIWPGDVVTTYALIGFVFLLFRKTSFKQDLYLGIIFFIVHILVRLFPMLFSAETVVETFIPTSYFSFDGVDNNLLIDRVRNDGVTGMYFFYLPQYKFLWSFTRLSSAIPSVIGLFFIGGYLFKSDFLNKHASKRRNILIFLVIGALGYYLKNHVAYAFRIIDNLFLSLAYMGIITRLFKTKIGYIIIKRIIPVGRMALTSYVMQSVFCAFVFYGFGLGLFAKLPLYLVYCVAITLLTLQIVFSEIWLGKYKYGPIEWIWRCLSYRKILPLKKQIEQFTLS